MSNSLRLGSAGVAKNTEQRNLEGVCVIGCIRALQRHKTRRRCVCIHLHVSIHVYGEGGGREREVNYKEFTDKSKFAGGPAGLGGSSVVPV